MKFGFDWPSGFREEVFMIIMVIQMAGAEKTLGTFFIHKHKSCRKVIQGNDLTNFVGAKSKKSPISDSF